jgi:hypothetical protein
VWIDITMLRGPTSGSFAQSVMSWLQRSPEYRTVSSGCDWLYISETAGCTLRCSRLQYTVCSSTCIAAQAHTKLMVHLPKRYHHNIRVARSTMGKLPTFPVGTPRSSDTLSSSYGKRSRHSESCRRPAKCLPIRKLWMPSRTVKYSRWW